MTVRVFTASFAGTRDDPSGWGEMKRLQDPERGNHVAILSAHRTVSMVLHTTTSFTKRISLHAEILNITFQS